MRRGLPFYAPKVKQDVGDEALKICGFTCYHGNYMWFCFLLLRHQLDGIIFDVTYQAKPQKCCSNLSSQKWVNTESTNLKKTNSFLEVGGGMEQKLN